MKLNKFSMMLAAAALVGCSDDFSERFADQAIDDARLIQLDPNFTLAGIGDEGNATRTHWTASLTNMFLPIYNATGPVAGHLLSQDVDLEKQAVGLCWMGQTEGSQVYTNYEFYHFGWLNAGVTGVPEYDKCSGNLTNGASYDDITITTTPTGTAENEAPTTDFVLPTWSTALNYNSGIYKTNNKAIFGGRYVVYYPYNPNFKDAGTIPVVYNTEVTRSATVDAPELGQATFRYSAPTTITGGAQAAGFNLKNLSTLVQLRIASAADKTWGDGGVRDETIDKIVLYSKKEQLLKQVNLCADKIAAGKTGTELYDDEKISAKKIVIDCGSGYALEKTSKNGAASTYITLLPTTVEDLQVLVHNSTSGHESWARYTVGNRTFEAGKADQVKIDLAKSNFNSDYIAVDDATLQAAITEIASATATIEVIGDITVSNRTIPANVTITGDKLIVPENVTLTVNGTVESEIEVYGKTCCSTATAGGRLVVGNVDAGNPAEVNKVTLFKTEAETPTDDLNPAITYTASQYSVVNDMNLINAGNVYVEGTVAHKGNFTTAGEAKVTVANTGDLNFMGATVVNNGTIEVKKAGQFDMTDENGDATADDGKNMTNNGIFIHNVDAAVGTAVQAMNQNGEYRCRVDEQKKLDDAYLQWTACNVIEIVEKSSP